MNDHTPLVGRARAALERLRDPALVGAATLAAAAALLWGLVPLRSWHVWWHLVMGRAQLHFGAVPAANHVLYSVPEEAPSLLTSWLAQRLLYAAYEIMGVEALLWLRGHLIAISILIVTWAATQAAARASVSADAQSGAQAASAVVWLAALGLGGLAAAVMAPAALTSPQLMAAPLWALVLVASRAALEQTPSASASAASAACAQTRQTRWLDGLAVAVCVGSAALWANLDEHFILAPLPAALVALALARRAPARAALWAAGALGAALATLLNPRGIALWGHVWTVLRTWPGHPLAAEGWASALVGSVPLSGATWAALAVSAALVALASFAARGSERPSSARAADVALAVSLIALTLHQSRALLWLGLALPLWLGPGLGQVMARALARFSAPSASSASSARLSWRVALSAWLLCATLPILTQPVFVTHAPIARALGAPARLGARGVAPHATTLRADVPVEVAQMIKRQIARPILYADLAATGYLLFELEPRAIVPMVFADGRVELLDAPRQALADLLVSSDLWRGMFQQWRVNVIVLHKQRQAQLLERVAREPDWMRSFEDEQWVYFVHMRR